MSKVLLTKWIRLCFQHSQQNITHYKLDTDSKEPRQEMEKSRLGSLESVSTLSGWQIPR
jgi:hypothetical protein